MSFGEVDPQVRDLSRLLLPDADALGARMGERIRAEVAWYADNDVLDAAEVDRNCADNVRYVLGMLAGANRDDHDVPRVTGIDRAGRGAPYAAVLQAFRVGGRFLWEVLVERAEPEARDLLLRSAADIWALSDELAAQVTEAFRGALVERARRDGQTRSVLVGTLLDGEGAHAEELWEIADALDLRSGGDFVIVSAHCAAPGAEALPDIERTLRRQNVTSAWRLVNHHQDGIVVLRFGFDLHQLKELLEHAAVGRIGTSTPFQRLEDAAEARRSARLACLGMAPDAAGVLAYDDDPLAILLASVPDQAAHLARALVSPVLDLPVDDGAVLVETARAWLAERGSTSTAARVLHVHRNTVRYRLRRIEELCGLDLADPSDTARLHIALEAVRILGLR
ncbi:MAG: helix-turn-helix domain-containing protein [Marmoricola sp.]